MVISPVTGAYNHVQIFFALERKKPLNMPVERHLEWLNAYICFKLLSSLRNLSLSRNCQMVTCTISGSYMSPRD